MLPEKQRSTAGALSVRCKLASLPSLPLTLFTFLQIVSTFCINNPGASEGEGRRREGVGGNPMALLLWKKKVEDGAGALADGAESCHRARVQTWRKKSKQGGDYI